MTESEIKWSFQTFQSKDTEAALTFSSKEPSAFIDVAVEYADELTKEPLLDNSGVADVTYDERALATYQCDPHIYETEAKLYRLHSPDQAIIRASLLGSRCLYVWAEREADGWQLDTTYVTAQPLVPDRIHYDTNIYIKTLYRGLGKEAALND